MDGADVDLAQDVRVEPVGAFRPIEKVRIPQYRKLRLIDPETLAHLARPFALEPVLQAPEVRRAFLEVQAAAEQAAREAASARESEINAWRGRIRDKIRGRANVPDTVTGRPVVAVRITLLPGGEVLDIRVEKSSGNRIFDEAIVRAIRSASPLPVPPASSELFPQFRDLRLNIDHDR